MGEKDNPGRNSTGTRHSKTFILDGDFVSTPHPPPPPPLPHGNSGPGSEGLNVLRCLSNKHKALVPFDVPVTIRSHGSKTLLDVNGSVKLSRDASAWDQWTISDAGNGKVLIKNNKSQNLLDDNGIAKLSSNAWAGEPWMINAFGNGKV